MKQRKVDGVRICRWCAQPIRHLDGQGRGQWARFCSDNCRTTASRSARKHIRQLRPGEPIPTGEPRRYTAGHGYIRLRWRVGPTQYVETYEHRVAEDVVTTAEHVHHINHDRSDNRPTNLEPLTAEEHQRQHTDHRMRILPEHVASLYQQGLSTVQIAERLGTHPGNISRKLAQVGTPARTTDQRYPIPPRDQVTDAYRRSASAPALASLLGLTVSRTRTAMKLYGLPSYPAGRRR